MPRSKPSRFALPLLCAVGLLCCFASSQTAVVLAPVPKLQFFDNSGRPLSFGCVFTYKVATTTPLATYTDYTGTVQNTNPVILTAGGFVGTGSNGIWLQAGLAYTFKVASAGGTHCATGSTLYTVDGIGGGSTVLTTVVPYSPTPSFQDAAQIQLFELTLTGDATAQPMTFVGVTPPGLIYFQITQDGSGGHTFTWPANTVGGCTIASGAGVTTTQAFVYNGTNATATGPCITGTGPAITAGSILDSGLTASSVVCTDANKILTSTCTGLIPNSALQHSSLTYNGQTVALGNSGNVNAGATAHSMTLNQGDGSAETGVTLTNDQLPVGRTSADPSATSLCSGTLTYNTSTHAFSCPVDQYVSTSGCKASGGSPCTVTGTWGSSFADNSYFVNCTPTGLDTSSAAYWISSKSTGTFVISITVLGFSNDGGFTAFDCHGHHN